MQPSNHLKAICMDHYIYKCCASRGFLFNFHNKCQVFVSCLTTVIKKTHLFGHFTLYIKCPFILFVMAGHEDSSIYHPLFL